MSISRKHWDLPYTVGLVAQLHGRKQELLVANQFNSALRRWGYAAHHVAEIEKLVDDTNAKWGQLPLPDRMFLANKVSIEEAGQYERNVNMVGVNATACIANLHAVTELFARALLHSLGMRCSDKKLFGKQGNVYPSDIQRLLSESPTFSILGQYLYNLLHQSEFKYIADVSNESKHNQLVKAGIIMDVREQDRLPFWAAFEGFERKLPIDRRDALEVLNRAKDKQLDLIIDAGNALTSILKNW